MTVDYYGDGLPDHPVEPDAISRMSANELLDLIDKIPEGYKTVFNLNVIEGYNHKDIAQLLGIEESSSRSQLTKARKYIQRSLEATQKVEL
jgi:RNA polymerase sigma-70 factor (ECF subfamily)